MRSKRHRVDAGSSSDSGRVTGDMEERLAAAVIRQMNLFHCRTHQQLERSHGAERMLSSEHTQSFVTRQQSSFSDQSRSWQDELQSAFTMLGQKQHQQDMWTRECMDVLPQTVQKVRDIDPGSDRPVKMEPQTQKVKFERDVRMDDPWAPIKNTERGRASVDVPSASCDYPPPRRVDSVAFDFRNPNPYTKEYGRRTGNLSAMGDPANLHKINPPPKFNAENLSTWKRELFLMGRYL